MFGNCHCNSQSSLQTSCTAVRVARPGRHGRILKRGKALHLRRTYCKSLEEGEIQFGGVTDTDRQYIRCALELAKLGIGKTEPNPVVGCVIVKDSKIIGEGYHPKAGEPHAEVFALRGAGSDAEGSTAYVTLEPCNHYGLTPPCSKALVEAKVQRVVVGVGDPNPDVGGAGFQTLVKAGIEVAKIGGEEEVECYNLNKAFMAKMEGRQ